VVRAQVLSTLTSKKWLTLKPADQFFFFRKTPPRLGQFSIENINEVKLTPTINEILAEFYSANLPPIQIATPSIIKKFNIIKIRIPKG